MSTRAEFLAAGAAALAVVALPEGGTRSFAMAADARTTTLGDWIRMLPNGTVEVFTDKVEMGMGVSTGLAQFVADELDVPFDRIKMMLGDTDFTVSAGGVGGSNSTFMGNIALRNAAAQMRAILVNEASARMGIPAGKLTVTAGVIHPIGDMSKSLTYTDVMAALFPSPEYPLQGEGFATNVEVTAKPKAFTQYKLAGSPIPRVDVPPKAFGRAQYVVDVRVPGMLHGRMIYPPGIGATVASVDAASIHGIGDARVVRKGSFVGVVASREWDAVRAARKLKVTWSAPSTTLPSMEKLADYMWAQQPTRKTAEPPKGNVDTSLGGDAIEARYFWPFQSHANMDPGCTVVDVGKDRVTVWSGTQKTHALRQGISKVLDVPLERVRVVWVEDAGSYGRGGLEESAAAAAYLSRAVGKPVRVQSMRADNTQWGNKAPAIVAHLRGKVQSGSIVALDSMMRQFNGNEILSQPSQPGTFLAAQLAGVPNGDTLEFGIYGKNSAAYEIPNVRAAAELIGPFAPKNSPLRTAHLRDPEGPGVTFVIESFVDELAAAAKADPVAFRIKHLTDQRHIDVIQGAAKAIDWETRPSATGRRTNAKGEHVGRGIAFATRGPTIIATAAEVAVNPQTGKARVTRIAAAQDCGFIVNPKSLQGTIEANIIQSLSRSLYEQATFDGRTVTSRDWRTYPVVHMRDVPDEVKVVMINRPSIRPGGAGEPTSRTTAAAVANAIFDATGARVRTAPMTPKNVLAAMKAQGLA